MPRTTALKRAWRYPRRWWLVGFLLLVLLSGLLGVLVFLAREYEWAREQEGLSRDVEALANDMRSELTRNTQMLQLLNTADPNDALWAQRAERLLQGHRELVRLEWRNPDMALLVPSHSPYWGDVFQTLPRDQALPDIRRACDAATRISGPSFSSNYFWPVAGGRGLELMEMCLPITQSGMPKGFLVATYSLPAMMAEWASSAVVSGRGLAFTEGDGTRLSLHSTVPGGRDLMEASALLDLPGHTLQLQLQSPRRALGLFPNVLTAVVGALSLSLLVVLAFLARDMRRRWRAERELADALAFRKAMENSLITGLRARDMQGRLTYVNPAFCDMVGWTAEQLLGSGLPAPYWPAELLDVYQQRQAVRLAGQALPREGFESMFLRSDGTHFPVLIIEAPLIDQQRRNKKQGVGGGQRQLAHRGGEEREHDDAQHAAQQVQRPADAPHRVPALAQRDVHDHQRQRGQPAQRRNLHHRVVVGQLLEHRVHERKKQHRHQHGQDAADIAAHGRTAHWAGGGVVLWPTDRARRL